MNQGMANFISMLMQNNPQIAQNAQAQQWLQVIQSGDSKKGEEIARNICKNMGVTPEQGYQSATQWANSLFKRK